MNSEKYTLILGSSSPRRKELLGWLGVEFQIVTSNCPEHSEEVDPHEFAKEVVVQKSVAVWDQVKMDGSIRPFVIAGDTIVSLDEKIYGKPKDTDHAKEILQELSGKTHQVISAVSFQSDRGTLVFTVETDVTFDEISKESMELYLGTGDSLDKAGAYGIQGPGLTFISSIRGSYSNVVGFPLSDVERELAHFTTGGSGWRNLFI